jgi:NAD(P)-dependent dehydrogenase (short-subunit alcohol dehydrogenase family)
MLGTSRSRTIDLSKQQSMRLANKVAIVTGSGSGIGRASALLFAREGAQVVVVDIDEKDAAQTAEDAKQSGGSVLVLQADVSNQRSCASIVEKAVEAYGRVDILFNNAGVASFKPVIETDEAEIDRVLGTNVKSVFFLSQAAIPPMKRQGNGSIINNASITGIVGAPGMAAYATSKGAIITLTRTMALEHAEDGIRVNCICPASIDTPMLHQALGRTPDPDYALSQNIKRHPLGRLGTPEDIAYFALFLASDESSFVTGGTHVVDGGALIARGWRE